jgi:hypothetical protein
MQNICTWPPHSVADPDPGSGDFFTPRIRDPVLFYPPDPGSGIKHSGSATLPPHIPKLMTRLQSSSGDS